MGIEAMAANFRDADEYLERRRKLGQKGYQLRDPKEDQLAPKPKVKAKEKWSASLADP